MPNRVQLYFKRILTVDEAREALQRPTCRLYARRGIGLHAAKCLFPIVYDSEHGGFDIKDNNATKLKQLKTVEDLVAFAEKLMPDRGPFAVTFCPPDETILAVDPDQTCEIPWQTP